MLQQKLEGLVSGGTWRAPAGLALSAGRCAACNKAGRGAVHVWSGAVHTAEAAAAVGGRLSAVADPQWPQESARRACVRVSE